MWGWIFRDRSAPLAGPPASRRQKTYSAQSGYVYQYTYEGCRQRAGDTEYVFSVGGDRGTSFRASVALPDDVIAEWEREHDLALRPNERYGIVKMALFQAFDEREGPGRMRAGILVRNADRGAIVRTLGLV